MLTATAKLPMTAAQIQQQHNTSGALQHLIVKLQHLTNLLTLPQSDTSHLITEVEAALVSLQVEQLHQQAIASCVWDFFPTPYPVIEQMLSLAQITPGMKVMEPSAREKAIFSAQTS